MRIVQRTFLYLISFVIIAAGAAIAAYPFNQQVVDLAHKLSGSWMLCLLVGCTALALGVFTILPFDLFQRKGRSISFAGPTGTVSILIDPFETSLRKTIAKLPMVKRVAVTVTPKDNDRKVGIEAVVSLKKPADASTREAAERLREFIDKVSRQILGADEITTVDVSIEDVLIDPTQTAESLNGTFAIAEESAVPVEKTIAPFAAAAAATSTIASTPAQQSSAYEYDNTETGRPGGASVDAEDDLPHGSELLTYEEASQLPQSQLPDEDDFPRPESLDGVDEDSESAFEPTAGDEPEQGKTKSEPNV